MKNKLAPYGTDGRLFASYILPTIKSTWHKTMPNIRDPARSKLDIVP